MLTPSDEVVNGEKRSHTARVASLALLYKVTEGWAVFGSVSQTERARTLEAGFSYGGHDLFAEGDSLDFKLTAFSNRVTDKIERPGAAVPETYPDIARAHIRGIELEGGYDADAVFGKFAYSRILGADKTTGERLNSTPADERVLELGARAFDQTLEYGWRGTCVRQAKRVNGDRLMRALGRRTGAEVLHKENRAVGAARSVWIPEDVCVYSSDFFFILRHCFKVIGGKL
ncbi:TonB-dependent receptor domain-containing protein [Roseinatronobacter monicus]|uniref:TonB-dependent receptor domain-containing protein n=1 Tax=Roseinatronobacter monicus TaxID=393481 RepID=UPI003F405916